MSNWIDRTIAYFAPGRGLARAQARAALGAIRSHELAYDGAKHDRRSDGWVTASLSGAAAAGQYHRQLRDRVRDLVRNNPHATKGLSVIVSNKVGSGILATPASKNKRVNARVAERLKRWADRCDVTGRQDLYGIQSLAERARAQDGEALVRFVPWKMESDLDVPLRLQVLEADYLDSDRHEQISDTRAIRYGVEYEGPRPVAYWLFETHPGDVDRWRGRKGYQSTRVPASEILHLFRVDRPGQVRGVTDFAPVMVRLRALDDYDDAEIMRKRISACLAAFVTTPQGLPGASIAGMKIGTDGERLEDFRPGMLAYLKPGESVTVADPKPSSDYEAFERVQLHAIAAGLGMPYELLTGDLSAVTYTSHRGGLVQFRGMVEADQWQTLVPQLCEPIVRRFTRELAGLEGRQVDPDLPWIFTPPRFGLLDPAKEIPALVQAIASGIDSYPNAIRREGYDWLEKLDEIEEFQRELARRGISLPALMTPPAPDPGDTDEEDVVDAA